MTLPIHRDSKNSLGLKHRTKMDKFGKMNGNVSGRAYQHGGKKKRDLKEVGNTSHTCGIGNSLFNFSQLSHSVL